eukprot:162452-Chlamydomonas_euryale.AAC.9
MCSPAPWQIPGRQGGGGFHARGCPAWLPGVVARPGWQGRPCMAGRLRTVQKGSHPPLDPLASLPRPSPRAHGQVLQDAGGRCT